MTTTQQIPEAFLWRRLHSFTGLWLTGYIIVHLFTNSQAALLIGDDGSGFIHAVNSIHNTPFLPIIEILILGVPILIHTIWGIKYLRTASYNSLGDTGNTPYLPEYPRNHAYTWQRITSWLLVVGIIAHIIHMRVIEYPASAVKGQVHSYMTRVTEDEGIYTVAARLGVKLYSQDEIQNLEGKAPVLSETQPTTPQGLVDQQALKQELNWLDALKKRPLREGELIAVSDNFGTAELLMLRDTFKMPIMIVLYTLFVLATCYHAFNGLWTSMITWGITLTQRAQYLMRLVSITLMIVVGGLGLSAVWLTYWINLKS
ncbi:MAG TPA: succinate dehydrogenase [Parachlamydiaceae bacterium]|nr:succinate dehydrogenase [Parachlamydiaceae bacterium]